MQGDNTLFQQLNNIIAFSLKDDHLKLLELHEKFKNFKVVNPYDRPDLAYKHAFGFFVSEYCLLSIYAYYGILFLPFRERCA